jgi:hypothetical protein
MLDVHPPHHSPNTWRAFLLHIATIVVGLLIAIGLEQSVEYLHHRHQVKETREALRQEREENRRRFAEETVNWRRTTAAVKNNLLVLEYLQQHPGTPQEKLPGILDWGQNNSRFTRAVWDAAQQTGVTSLMPREEVTEYAQLYRRLQLIGEADGTVWAAMNDAQQYNLTDYDPSHLSPAKLAEVIELSQDIQTTQYLFGIDLKNLAEDFRDFPASVTQDELGQLRHSPDHKTWELLASARALTRERIRAGQRVPGAATQDPSGSQTHIPEKK